MLPWLGSISESLELPGGTKIKYREQLEQGEDARKVGLLGTPTEKDERSDVRAILAREDPNLALASLRIEIEKRLVAIAAKHGLGTERQSIGILLRRLKERKALSNEQASVLQDMIGLLNRAVHGAEIGQQEAQWAIEIRTEFTRRARLSSRLMNPRLVYKANQQHQRLSSYRALGHCSRFLKHPDCCENTRDFSPERKQVPLCDWARVHGSYAKSSNRLKDTFHVIFVRKHS